MHTFVEEQDAAVVLRQHFMCVAAVGREIIIDNLHILDSFEWASAIHKASYE